MIGFFLTSDRVSKDIGSGAHVLALLNTRGQGCGER